MQVAVLARLDKTHRKLIDARRACSEAGKQQCDKAVDIGAIVDVGGSKEVRIRIVRYIQKRTRDN